jgi:deazaflavin-dependent oxidoreductase (nitroreductase family)
MPLPHLLGRFNVLVTNPLLWPIVRRLPGGRFGRVVHVGRRSGRVYRTTMLAFPHGDRVVFALTYGPDAQWVRNVLARGACEFETRQGARHLVDPRLVRDRDRRLVPSIVRPMLGWIRAYDFLELTVGETADVGDRSSP